MREVVEIRHRDATLSATRHEPETPARGTGALVVNFGPIPRTGVGDLAVKIADALSHRGIIVYRVDLPGVGDSEGELPEQEEPYFEAIQQGENAEPVARVSEQIVREHDLHGVVLIGLCSGAWTAGYAAQHSEAITGLVMLEPELRAAPKATQERPGHFGRLSKLTSPLAWTRLIFGENRLSSRLGGMKSVGYRLMLRISGDSMPSDTCRALLASWKDAARRRLPVLVVTAARSWREMYVLRALEWLNRRLPGHCFSHAAIDGTNHIFAAGNGAVRVVPIVEKWVDQTFLETADPEEVTANAAP